MKTGSQVHTTGVSQCQERVLNGCISRMQRHKIWQILPLFREFSRMHVGNLSDLKPPTSRFTHTRRDLFHDAHLPSLWRIQFGSTCSNKKATLMLRNAHYQTGPKIPLPVQPPETYRKGNAWMASGHVFESPWVARLKARLESHRTSMEWPEVGR